MYLTSFFSRGAFLVVIIFVFPNDFQSLQPTDPPIFEVTDLLMNETDTQLVLWGNLGVVVVELPKRWGKDAQFQGGKDVISCL